MTAKALTERRRAKQDIEDAVDHDLAEGAAAAASAFLEALAAAYELIAEHPTAGPPTYLQRFGGPRGLRGWALRGFPYIVFYIEGADRIDVVRVLHGRRDVPDLLRDG